MDEQGSAGPHRRVLIKAPVLPHLHDPRRQQLLHLLEGPDRVPFRVGAAVRDVNAPVAQKEFQQQGLDPGEARSQAALSLGRIRRAGSRAIPSVRATRTMWWFL